MNKASSCWGPKTFFLEHEASPTSSPQPAASLSTAPSVGRWTERSHTGQLPQPFDLNKALTLTGTDPKKDGSNALGFQSRDSADS